jgi:hypothetical protein
MNINKRTFLTGLDADSYLKFYVRTTPTKQLKGYTQPPEIEAELKIADCYRTVTLSFGKYGNDKNKNLQKLYKVQKLINEFVKHAEQAHEEYPAELTRYNELKKAADARKRKLRRTKSKP